MVMEFIPTREAGLARLNAFLPRAGRAYAAGRNYDEPDNVSGVSPYLRHRIVTEPELLKAVLARHSPEAAEKFIQEVYWRTYWKGWLEMRPPVWAQYRAGLQAALNRVQTEAGLRRGWEAACAGETGIDAFDHWARQLAETGYLHNHARMWFASIWVFTLHLPWELGADFFLRHLLDGDPASNTLGWRWVAGLQTPGKTYLARPDNIAKYTRGRFRPEGLAHAAPPLNGPPHPPRMDPPTGAAPPRGRVGVLLTEDDLSPDWLLSRVDVVEVAVFDGTALRSPLHVSGNVQSFVASALDDLDTRIRPLRRLATTGDVTHWAEGFEAIALPHPPVGATADALRPALPRARTHRMLRDHDRMAWPHATAGFFKFKKNIPELLKAHDRQADLFE
ncbi:MAG: DNA photolyase [Alphaproteobacteria bacterium]|jgi:deoxyribodipyrimidine photo-lyase|nr:DNA photolyase [Alphaproteobacteria bacterium]